MSSASRRWSLLLLTAALALPPGVGAQWIALGPELQVNSHTTDTQREPAVAADDAGFVVVWSSNGQDGWGRGVFARRFTSAGTPLATEFQVNSYTTQEQTGAAVAMGGAGDFVVTWHSFGDGQDGDLFGVFGHRFSSAGTPLATEFQVSSYTVGPQFEPSLALDANGDFVVAWTSNEQDGDGSGVFARRFASSGTALAAELQVHSFTIGDQRTSSVAAAADGDFVVTWASAGQDGSGSGIFAQRFSSSGAALAAELQVNSHTIDAQYEPSVSAAADGDFVVAWYSHFQDGSGAGVFARRFTSSATPLATEFQVNSRTSNDQNHASVTADADGDFAITWESYQQDGSGAGVFARRFTSTGIPVAAEFQVNSLTMHWQYGPALASDSGGDFVIAWTSQNQDGSNSGVFAQRFVLPKILDIDANGSVGALTDGLLVLRYLFGFTGATLVTGAVDLAGCTRCDAGGIEVYLATLI